MAGHEKVLVIERAVLEQTGMFNGLVFDVERYLDRIFSEGVCRFIERGQAEDNPAFKQLIPYVIMAFDGSYLSYVRGRRAGEARLVGNRSIGIGGHINPQDDMPLFSGGFRETYLAAVEREVSEEVHVEAEHSDRIVALLNDESNEVGRVHLGVVHFWKLASSKVKKREQMITQMAFLGREELLSLQDRMETWSRLCLQHLVEMEKRG